MKSKYDAVLFDFDGTIADTGRGIFSSIQYAVECLGFEPLDNATLRRFIGPPIYDSFKRELGLDEEKSDFAVKKYREKYAEKGIYEFELYDGILPLMKTLHERGIKVGIASSKPQNFLIRIVDFLNVGELIDFISAPSADDTPQSKTSLINNAAEALNIGKDKILMVGDRYFDIDGANGAGVESVGVTFGYGIEAEFKKSGATFIAGCADEIADIIFCC
ncbi:MAG: HAD hydrolase-like protein [Clostridia bacterium]|nr:HAD hydrolase-like protein [Clostridia bacterium]